MVWVIVRFLTLEKETTRHNPIGVSTYSFWQFNGPKEAMPIDRCIDLAARMGFDGMEIHLGIEEE